MTRSQIKVLLIEDSPADVLLLKESLSTDPLSDFQITVVELLKLGLKKLAEENFDVLLLDLGLPDSQGLKTFESVHAQFFNIPIIVLSGMKDDSIALQAMQSGAQDYLVKGETGWSLGARAIRYAIERHQSQLARNASEKRFSTFFHFSPIATAITRLNDSYIVEVNEAWCQFTGYSVDNVVGHEMNSLNIWVDPKKRMEFIELMRRDGKVHEFEFQMRHRSNKIKDVLFSAELIELAGEPCIVSMAQDITERKRNAELLQASEMRFRSLIEHGMDNISLLDVNGTLLWENPSAVQMLGYKYDQFKGENIFALMHPDDLKQTQMLFTKILNQPGNIEHSSFRLKHANGSWRWVEAIGTNLLHESSVGAIVINYRDVTERKLAERALQMRTEDLALTNSLNEAANRGDSIDSLVNLFAEKIEGMIPSYRGASIYLFDHTEKNLELRGITISATLLTKIEKLIGRPIPKLDIPLNQGSYFQKLLESEQGTIISDPETLKQWIAEFTETTFLPTLVRSGLKKFIPQIYSILNITSVITVPLISSGKAIGLLDVSSEAVLSEEDLKRIRDISSQVTAVILRKQAEEQLNQSQLRLQMAFNAVKMGIHEWDAKTDQLIWDDRMRELWELPPDVPLTYELFMQGIHPEDRDRVMTSIRKLTDPANDKTQMIEYRVIGLQTGTERWLELKGKMYYADGQPNRLLGTAVDITERKQSEQALLQSHEMLAKLTAQVPGVVYQYRLYPDGRSAFPFASPGMNNIYEVTPKEVQEDATPVFGRLHPEDASRVTEDIFESARTLKPFHCEFRVVLPKQGLRWRLSDALPEKLEDGSTLWYGIISDITERKEAEEILRKSEDRFRNLFENAPIGVLLADPQGNILEVNPAALQILGSPSTEATRQINILTFPPLIQSEISADFQQCVQTIQPLSSEHPYHTKWGKHIDLNLRFAPLIDMEGKLLHIQILIEDVTARKKAEYALQESQRHYRALFEDSPLAIWEEDFSLVKEYIDSLKKTGVSDFQEYFVSNPDEVIKCIKMIKVLDVNSAALKMYQATSKEILIENTLQTLCVGETDHNMEDFIAIAEGRTSNSWDGGDEKMTGEPIEISLTWSIVPGYENDFSKVIVTTVDITDRKQAEALIYQYANELELRVEERTAELVHASRAKDEFLANMSHELRTPLNGILGFSETLLEGIRGPLNEKQGQAVEIIQSSGQHLLGLINDILDVSKIESGKFEVVPETIMVNDICRSSLNFIKQMANKKSIRVEYIPQPAATSIVADPKRLKQILVNLLNNAVKFTPEKGSIKLDVQTDSSAGMMRFSITDTGIGIAPENQQKLFKPFIQVDSSLSRQYEGTGLGLSLVKKLVEMQGGSVELKSEVGQGSCFSFTLPWQPATTKEELRYSEQSESGKHHKAANEPPTHRKKVLLADDNESNILMVKDYLESRSYQVRIAYNGIEAIREADEFLPDIILLDIQMPQMNGFEATSRLRSDPRFVTVPIIALTAFAMSGDRERCLEAGMDEYISKPIKLKVLQQMIEKLLDPPKESLL